MKSSAYIRYRERSIHKTFTKKGLIGMQNERKKAVAGRERGVAYKVRVKKRFRHGNGITNSSKWAEQKVLAHVGGEVPADRNQCDVVVPLGDVINGQHEIKIEVKSMISPEVSAKTVYTANQVRPYRYNIMVVVVENLPAFGCDCLVFSAVDVMKKALPNLGQHTKDSMLCCNFSLRPSDAEEYGCSFHELRDRIVEAFMTDYTSDKGEFARYEIARRMREYDFICESNRTLAKILNS